MRLTYLLTLVFLFAITTSCSDGDDVSSLRISDYVEENNLTTIVTQSGLNYIITREGTGARPNENSDVTVNFVGYFLNGETFDSGDNVTFNLQEVIRGWTEGMQFVTEGGAITLLVPFNLGFGSFQRGDIPPNTNIGFDIELISVN
jgi:FKBP-type peptidyl-prolyl cis-trans isomerase FkpA